MPPMVEAVPKAKMGLNVVQLNVCTTSVTEGEVVGVKLV